jgi:hypothetical protein
MVACIHDERWVGFNKRRDLDMSDERRDGGDGTATRVDRRARSPVPSGARPGGGDSLAAAIRDAFVITREAIIGKIPINLAAGQRDGATAVVDAPGTIDWPVFAATPENLEGTWS